MPSFCVEFKGLNILSVTDYTSQNTIVTLHDVTKVIANITLLGWKQSKANHVLICSNIPIARVTIKPILIYVSSGNISSITNGT